MHPLGLVSPVSRVVFPFGLVDLFVDGCALQNKVQAAEGTFILEHGERQESD